MRESSLVVMEEFCSILMEIMVTQMYIYSEIAEEYTQTYTCMQTHTDK